MNREPTKLSGSSSRSSVLLDDCSNAQCEQVHTLLDALLDSFGVQGHQNCVSAGKAFMLAEQINMLRNDNAKMQETIQQMANVIARLSKSSNAELYDSPPKGTK